MRNQFTADFRHFNVFPVRLLHDDGKFSKLYDYRNKLNKFRGKWYEKV